MSWDLKPAQCSLSVSLTITSTEPGTYRLSTVRVKPSIRCEALRKCLLGGRLALPSFPVAPSLASHADHPSLSLVHALAPHLASFTLAMPCPPLPTPCALPAVCTLLVLTHRSPLRCPLWKAAFSIFSRGALCVLITFQFLPLLSQSPTVIVVMLTIYPVSQGKKLVLEFTAAPPGPNSCPAHRRSSANICSRS